MIRFKKSEKNTSNKASSSRGGRSVIGLDIGQGGIRMVQLSGRDLTQVQLEKYAIVSLPNNVVSGNEIVDFDQLVAHLQQCYSKLKTNCKQVNIALPVSIVTIEENLRYNPKDSDVSLQELVEAEIARVGALDSINYDWYEMEADASGEQAILIAAAKTEDVDRHVDLLDEVGLQAANVDVDLFAMANAFIYADEVSDSQWSKSKILLVDVGDVNLRALVMEQGKMIFRHEAQLGFEQLVQLVQRTYQCSEGDAIDMIYEEVERPDDYHELVTESFNMQIAQEVQRALQFFMATQNVDQAVDISNILISGIGCTGAKDLDRTIYSQTNIAAQQLSPVSLADNKSKVDDEQLARDADSLTMAFGLALRGLA